ncbi:MAG: spore coat polysaccharide biosynthesis predicted glycosyltransferase SpsG [Planctomycetota bacterium]|jgi:spore coat polysaccharide biosynthesis predicted glycosyltransferase SpsG
MRDETPQKFVLRAAGGPATGVGHLVRTRSLAQECDRRGIAYDLIVDDEDSAQWLTQRGVPALAVDTCADWADTSPRAVWLDGFRDWRDELNRLDTKTTCVILAENRIAERDRATFTVYPALHYTADDWDSAHSGRVRGGLDWIPLAHEVLNERVATRDVDLLVSFGGCDPAGLTERTLLALAMVGFTGSVRTVIGPRMIDRADKIRHAGRSLIDHELVDGGGGIAHWQARSRTAITALGTTLYELAWFAVPALILANYPEDRTALDWYEKRGCHLPLGVASEMSQLQLCRSLSSALHELDNRPQSTPLDLAGGCARIVNLLMTEAIHA